MTTSPLSVNRRFHRCGRNRFLAFDLVMGWAATLAGCDPTSPTDADRSAGHKKTPGPQSRSGRLHGAGGSRSGASSPTRGAKRTPGTRSGGRRLERRKCTRARTL
jgi:hypothetical protein